MASTARKEIRQDGKYVGDITDIPKKKMVQSTDKSWKQKRRDGVSQDGGGTSRTCSRVSVTKQTVQPLNPGQTARRDKVQLEEDLPDYSLYSSLKDGIDGETRVLAAAKGATFLAHKSLSTMCWVIHEEGLTERPDVLRKLKHELFRALAKLALTIFDLEDFDRIVFKDDIMAERMKFLHDVDQTSSKTTTEAILDIAKGKMDFGKYPRLLERDVGNILELRERYSESSGHWNLEDYVIDDYTWSSEDYVTDDYTWSFEDVNIQEPLLGCTIAVMKKMSPLKLCNSICSAIFPLLFGAFGDWAQEVIDVVEHADCERRWEGDSFIRNRHLLLGLLSSRIAESVQEFGRFRDDRKESSMHHVYETYKVTEDVARMFGDNEIKLEHLFLAILVVNLGFNKRPQWIEDLQRTRNGRKVEEYIPLVWECMFKGFGIDFGNLDTKAFVGNGIANEREKWDASIAENMVKVVYEEIEKIKGSGHPTWSDGSPLWDSVRPLWDSVRPITQLCKSHRLPMIWENGEEDDSLVGKLKSAEAVQDLRGR